MNKKLVPAVCIAAGLIGVSACGGGNAASEGPSGSSSAPAKQPGQSHAQAGGKQSMPTPDLKGIPAVVATVNGQKISKGDFVQVYESQFQQLAVQAQMSGQKLDQTGLKQQVAQNMVGSILLTQEADKRPYAPSKGDVDRTLTDLAQQNGMKSSKQLMDALTQQGRTKGAIVAQVKEQAKVNHLVVHDSGSSLAPTKKEVKQAYQLMSRQTQGSKAPSFQQVRPQLEQRLKMEKTNQAAQTVVEHLRKNAHVKINL